MMSKLLCFILVILCAKVESANILAIYPMPSISHQVVFRRLTLELVRLGHNVTVITTNPAFPNKDGPENLKEIDLQNVSYTTMAPVIKDISRKSKTEPMLIKLIRRIPQKIFEVQMQEKEVKDVLQNSNTNYDLIILEETVPIYLFFSHIIRAPVILISSLGGTPRTFNFFGLQPHHIVRLMSTSARSSNVSLWEKIKLLYMYYSMFRFESILSKEEDKLLQKYFGPGTPSINELFNNVHMIFLNVHSIWAENRPVPSNFVYLGGLHQLEPKELPQDFKTFLDSSERGVIYISFGTNALSSVLPMKEIRIIADVLGRLPYDVLWKWDQDTLPGGQAKNIKLSKWFPQADLLRHPKVKLFITQAGLQSTDEAITAGVPLLAFPLFSDQFDNADKYERHGIGKKFLLHEITEETVRDAIEDLIEHNQRYRDNIVKLRNIMEDQPLKPLERAVFWVDHVLRHKGAKHLAPAPAPFTFQQFQALLIFLLVSMFSICATVATLVAYILSKVTGLSRSHKLKQT